MTKFMKSELSNEDKFASAIVTVVAFLKVINDWRVHLLFHKRDIIVNAAFGNSQFRSKLLRISRALFLHELV